MIIVFCGPPASGKSTIARKLAEKLENSKLVSSDEFKRKTYKRMFAETEKWAGKVKYLILNGTFYKREWRDGIKRIAEGKGEGAITFFITCSLDTCLKRNESRKNQIEEKAVRIIYGQMEKPEDQYSLIDTDVLSVDEAIEAILKILSAGPNFKNSINQFASCRP
jgi:tRNA uridine 5-carbamoylmethylation protein Kti12